MGKGYFTLKFASNEAVSKVWAQGVDSLKPGVLRFMRWSPNFSPANKRNTNAQVWVRLWDLGLQFWEPVTLFEIANGIGVPVKIDHNTLERRFGLFARVLVDVDLSCSPPCELVVRRSNGEIMTVEVEYERLPDFCSHCGNVGHRVIACKLVQKPGSVVVYVAKEADKGKQVVIDSTPKAIDDSGEGPSFVRKSSSLGVGQHEVVTAMVEKVVEQSHALIESHVQDNVHEPSLDSPRERIIDESRNKSPMVLELAHPNRFQQLVIHEQDDASENGSENVIELEHSDEEMLAARVVLEVVLDVSKQKQNDQEHNGSSGGASMDAINSGTEIYDSQCELSSPT
ncbi:hypothetical protein ACLB2K_003684 [Fragaria x ananassa]